MINRKRHPVLLDDVASEIIHITYVRTCVLVTKVHHYVAACHVPVTDVQCKGKISLKHS